MKPRKSIRVLVIEDDEDVAKMIKSLLSRTYGAKADIAKNRAAARERLASDTYDIITLDYRLPDCYGLDMLDEITASEGHPPVVMITGFGGEELAYLSFRMGASGFASKDDQLPVMLTEAIDWALADDAVKRAHGEHLKRDVEAMAALARDLRSQLEVVGVGTESIRRLLFRIEDSAAASEIDRSTKEIDSCVERSVTLAREMTALFEPARVKT